MAWTGGCLCGAVRYEATASPGEESGYCHCRMCQKAFGNGFSVFVQFASESFRLTRGEPVIYKSSNVGERGLCANCGAPVTMRYSTLPASVWVFVGTLDRPGDTLPYLKAHLCVESEIPWLTIHDDLPRRRSEEEELYAAIGLELDDDSNQ